MENESPIQGPACDSCRVKKVRCGRERPKCQNCERYGCDCIFTNRGKRPNQTKKVIEDIGELHERLESIHGTVEMLADLIQRRMIARPDASSNTLPPLSLDYTLLDNHFGLPSPTQCQDLPNLHQQRRSGESRTARHSISRSLLSTACQVECALSKLSQPGDATNVPVQQLTGRLSSFMQDLTKPSMTEGDKAHATSPDFQLPPKGLLKACLTVYIPRYHWRFPFFDENKLLQQIESAYENPHSSERNSMAIILNSIVARALCIRIEDGISKELKEEASFSSDPGMDGEFLKEFLVRTKAGASNPDIVFCPRIVNVQALIAMYLIAQDHFDAGFAELVLYHACSLSKSIGLHRRTEDKNPTSSEPGENDRLFWTLFRLDQTHSQLFDRSPCFITADCGVDPPVLHSTGPCAGHFALRTRLSLLEDRLQSFQAATHRSSYKGESDVHEIIEISGEISDLEMSVDLIKDDQGTNPAIHLATSELKYLTSAIRLEFVFLTSRSQAEALTHARNNLRLMRRSIQDSPQAICIMELLRVFLTCSHHNVLTIFNHIINSSQPPENSDLELVNFVAGLLEQSAAVQPGKSTQIDRLYDHAVLLTQATQLAAETFEAAKDALQSRNHRFTTTNPATPSLTQSCNSGSTLNGFEDDFLSDWLNNACDSRPTKKAKTATMCTDPLMLLDLDGAWQRELLAPGDMC